MSVGELAANAFRLFGGGYSLRQCVELLKMDPTEINRLYASWERNDLRETVDAEHEAKLRSSRRG